MSANMLDKGYEPHDVEKKWYKFWEEENLFGGDDASSKPSFSIVIPPPNVTGVLHMGHALNNTLQDILCRYRRLRGDNVLWIKTKNNLSEQRSWISRLPVFSET